MSLQVFDAAGVAVHKVCATEASEHAAFAGIARALADPDPMPPTIATPTAPAPDRPDAAIDADGLRAALAVPESSHDFLGRRRRLGVGRSEVLRLAGPDLARPAPPSAARMLLHQAAADGTRRMIFVGSPGCGQIHCGPVLRIEAMDPRSAFSTGASTCI